MNYFEAIVLGFIQGATEFLPISSSGHLIILRKIFNITEYSLLLEVALHIGTLISILIFWHKDYLSELKKIKEGEFSKIKKVFIGCIPAALVGFFLKENIKNIFYDINSLNYLFISYIVMSCLLYCSKYFKDNKDNSITYAYALLIGISQALAIIPGISRSGITIITALFLGISFKKSIEFSFILVIPILIFAGIDSFIAEYHLIIKDINTIIFFILGLLSSVLFGYFFLLLLQKIIIKNKFWYFSFYCLFISILLLIFTYGK